MKIPSAPLFVGTFLVCTIPWCVYALWLLRYMRYRMRGLSPRPSAFDFLVARRALEKTPDVEGKRLVGQCFRWMRICFLTWGVGFVLLTLLVFGLDRLGWLARG